MKIPGQLSVQINTTAIMGNCGMGFAPVRPGIEARDYLITVMEGVEDIPGTVLAEGVSWDWESFPEYLDSIDRKPHAIDVVAQVPHAPLGVWSPAGAALEAKSPPSNCAWPAKPVKLRILPPSRGKEVVGKLPSRLGNRLMHRA